MRAFAEGLTTPDRLVSASNGSTIQKSVGSIILTVLGGLAAATAVHAQEAAKTDAKAGSEEPAAGTALDEVVVTGTLIRGTQAVGGTVTSVGPADFPQVGANSVTDILRLNPALNIIPSLAIQAANQNFVHLAGIQIHELGQLRTLLLIDGMRYPLSNTNATLYDASIIPSLALERADVLADGASATYGSDAVAGVVNLVLRRGFEGAISQSSLSSAGGGNPKWQISQLLGHTWESGDVTLTLDFYKAGDLAASKRSFETANFQPWGLNNVTPLTTSTPAVISVGAPSSTTGTNCSNCYSVPHGQNGQGLTWATLLGNPGVKNEVGLYKYADILGPDQRASAVLTFDQKIVDNVSLYGEAFYSDHGSNLSGLPSVNPSTSVALSVPIPASNPYFPTGAPSNIVANYNLAGELSSKTYSWQHSARFSSGLKFDLASDWIGKVFISVDDEHSQFDLRDIPNPLNVSAALGNTVTKSDPVLGTTVTYSKPANVPYLNVFCDPSAYQCNSPATLNYIEGQYRDNNEYLIQEVGTNFDGTLFRVPGGEVQAAVGGDFRRETMDYETYRSYNSPSVTVPYVLSDSSERRVFAVFGQVDVPILGGDFSIPLVKKLDVEVSGRYDHYDDFGGTTNPKFGANWVPFDGGLTLRGSWGKSFRAPTFNDLSGLIGKGVGPANAAAGGTANNTPACLTVGGRPISGSVAAILNPTCSAALQYPGGATVNAGVGGLAGVTRPSNYQLGPEKADTYSLGFDFKPTFFRQLTVGASYFSTTIHDVIQSPTGNLNDPSVRPYYLLPGDPGFAAAVAFLASNPAQLSAIKSSGVQWVFDGAVRNLGEAKVSGIDYNGRYDIDILNTGDWHIGVTGSYILHNILITPGFAPQDSIVGANVNAGIGNNTAIESRYRAELGWQSESRAWSATAYANYQGSYYTTQTYPPASVLPANWSNRIPAFTTIDLSFGYGTGDSPSSNFLKNLSIQLVIQNIVDRQPPFAYIPVSSIGTAAIDGANFSPMGRVAFLSATKKW